MLSAPRAWGARRAPLLSHGVLAAVCYLPLLASGRGRLAADTRQAVYLDPGRFIHDALSMWDPSRDLGTVTHQNIVLVWPMGAYYWLADVLGVPQWIAQRAWLGSILFLAGAGVLHLARTIRWSPDDGAVGRVGPVVAAFAYAMSPYVLQYGTRTSVLLLPWAALPWLIALTARSLETRGWRHPALIALVTLSIAVNATALALALLGPALWVAWAVWGTKEVPWRAAVAAIGRIAVLGAVTSLWWVVALLIEGRFGLPLLSFTETIDQVASTSAATEVLRGLGYWVPYLASHGYPEVVGSSQYLDNVPVMALQFGVVVATFVGIGATRWRHRLFFGALVVVGVVVGIGAYPTTQASPLSSLFHDLARSGGVGLALRSTTRAAPLALLGLACLLGAFVDALLARVRRTGVAFGAAVVILAVVLSPSVGGRKLVDPIFSRPEHLPDHWTAALAAADARAGTGRMLEIPGIRFASYRWGTTYEPVTAGNAATPSAWREQIPYGGPGSADVLVALDNRIQEGLLDPDALAPVARLLGASELLVRNDLEYERYDNVAPDRVWRLVDPAPAGLGDAAAFGPVGTNRPDPAHRRDDEPKPDDPDATYPALGLVPVHASPGLVQVVPVRSTVVLDGDADGIVDAAGAGALDGRAPVLEAAATVARPGLLDDVLAQGAPIVLTDTNRRRVRRWRHIKNTDGITLRADQDPADEDGKDGGEAPLDVFPGTGSDWQTVAVPTGAEVTATRFGNPLWFESGLRPAAALDGDRNTGWQAGPFIGGIGDRLTIEPDHPIRTDHLALSGSRGTTLLTAVDVRFDDGPPVRYALGPQSREPGGQVLRFPERSIAKLSIELAATAPASPGAEPASFGIDEVGLDDGGGELRVVEGVRLPRALTDRLGARSVANPLSIVLTRLRGDAADPHLFREERTIDRTFRLPTARTFSVVGAVRAAEGTSAEMPEAAGCRSDLLSLDGVAVPVRVGGSVAGAAVPAARRLEACAPLDLEAGEHHLLTTTAEVDVDQLLLASAAGGGPTAVDGGTPVLPPRPAATVTFDQRSKTDVRVKAKGVRGPAWLVLAESRNDGWTASGPGVTAGKPVLLNGFANAWYLRAPPASATYSLRWTPQRTMDLALVVSLVGILVAAFLAVRGRAWHVLGSGPDLPALDAPWRALAPLPARRVAITAALTGLAAAAVIQPWWGVAVAAAVVVAGRWRRGHGLLRAGAVVVLTTAFAAVVVDRIGREGDDPFTFFTSQHTPHRIALLAVALLAADLLLSRVREELR